MNELGRNFSSDAEFARACHNQLPKMVDKAASDEQFETGCIGRSPEGDAHLVEMGGSGLSNMKDAGVEIHRAALSKQVLR